MTASSAVGAVAGLWRHPVKSMQGTAVDQLDVDGDGVIGDRRRALIDHETGTLMSAKRWSRLLEAAADDEGVTLSDGRRVVYSDPGADAALSEWLGRPVRFAEPTASTEVSYEMTFDPPDDDAEFVPIPAPPGSFRDLAGAHLITTATLAGCAEARPDLDWDVRRFRPNLVIDAEVEPFGEDDWCGGRVRVGGALFDAVQPAVRCAMPLRAQPGLDRQAELYAALEELHGNHLGIYLDVAEPGVIEVGDPVTLEPAP